MYEHGGIEKNGGVQERAEEPNCLHEGPYTRIHIVSTGVVTQFCARCVAQVTAFHKQAGASIQNLGPAE